jgi:plastocyanin
MMLWAAGSTPSATTVHMRDLQFKPTEITVPVGATVTFVNDDDVPHNVTGTSGGGLNSGDINGGKNWQFTFSKQATYRFTCSYHPWMKGTITVTDAQASPTSPPAKDARTSLVSESRLFTEY